MATGQIAVLLPGEMLNSAAECADRARIFFSSFHYNGKVIDKPQRAQAHNSTHYRCQLSFMCWLCSIQNCLLCGYEHDYGDNYIITIVSTGLATKTYVAVLSVLNLVSDFVKCNHPIHPDSFNHPI
jgi:hypothetical protein